ncbi:MAG: Trm112 family protein [Candidatus Hydrogenedentales bacterium]|jgi:uncharacterized protein YbaR (Trm112 family)
MIDQELIDILVCPENKSKVTLAEQPLVDKANAAIEARTLTSRGGEIIDEKIEGGLVREDGVYMYPIREEIPIMLIDEAIPLEQLT